MVMPSLLLQKPSYKSTSKEHSQCLDRRMTQWECGDFNAILSEVRTIQKRLPKINKLETEEHSCENICEANVSRKGKFCSQTS